MCPFGSVLPSKTSLLFMEASLRLAWALHAFYKNSTSIETETTTPAVNMTTPITVNMTTPTDVNTTQLTLAERLREFIANKTIEIVEAVITWNVTHHDILGSFADWLEMSKVMFPGLSSQSKGSFSASSTGGEVMGLNANSFYLLGQTASRLNLPPALIVYPMYSQTAQRLDYDLRGTDPLGTAINDLRMGLTRENQITRGRPNSASNQTRRDFIREERQMMTPLPDFIGNSTSSETIDDESWTFTEFLEDVFLPNISLILDHLNNVSR